jgi:hypothetical protein
MAEPCLAFSEDCSPVTPFFNSEFRRGASVVWGIKDDVIPLRHQRALPPWIGQIVNQKAPANICFLPTHYHSVNEALTQVLVDPVVFLQNAVAEL